MSRPFRYSAELDAVDSTDLTEICEILFDLDDNVVITDIDDGPEPGVLAVTISSNDRALVKRAISRWIDETGQDADATDDAYLESQIKDSEPLRDVLVQPETEVDDNAPAPQVLGLRNLSAEEIADLKSKIVYGGSTILPVTDGLSADFTHTATLRVVKSFGLEDLSVQGLTALDQTLGPAGTLHFSNFIGVVDDNDEALPGHRFAVQFKVGTENRELLRTFVRGVLQAQPFGDNVSDADVDAAINSRG
jgi:hypothetical protein